MYVRDGTTHFSDAVVFWGLWSKAFFSFNLDLLLHLQNNQFPLDIFIDNVFNL